MRWAEMTVLCAPEAVDAVSYAYIDHGCGGVMMTGTNPVKVQGSLPVTDELTGRIRELSDHLQSALGAERFDSLLRRGRQTPPEAFAAPRRP